MASGEAPRGVFQRLDRLNEFERQPVTEDKLHSGRYFAGMFAGEHVAATEFVIGVLFVIWGARTFDVLVGLLLGNLLAVLSWALICAPIAVQTRLTLYWYLRRIAGPVVMVLYNVLNAVLYCILAGCMITVSASAVRIPFGIEPQTDVLPTDPWFVAVVLGVGALVVLLAILGFKRLAQFATVCSPWMLLMFVAGALVMLPTLGHVGSWASFRTIADEQIWAGDPPTCTSMTPRANEAVLKFDYVGEKLISAGGGPLQGFSVAAKKQAADAEFVPAEAKIDGKTVVVSSPKVKSPAAVRYEMPKKPAGALCSATFVPAAEFRTDAMVKPARIGFWHIVAFAWICNLAMHLGLSDMAILRFARKSWYGLYSAFGMYLGHYLAWACAGIMGAAAVKMMATPLVYLDSGQVAFKALSWMGVLAVVIAGWTTANPTIYRAGLALQAVSPNWPRWLVTLIAGTITTIIACFPFVFRYLLDFVGVYGLLLMPVGAIVVMEHWVFPRVGLKRFWSARKGQMVNWPALIAWAVALGAAVYCWQTGLVHLFFLAGPVWLLTAVVYLVLAAMAGARQSLPELPEEAAPAAAGPATPTAMAPPTPGAKRMMYYTGGLALLCLVMCVFLPLCVFFGFLETGEVTQYYLNIVTLVYFVAGTLYLVQREKLRLVASAAELQARGGVTP